MNAFDYARPSSLEDCVALLSEGSGATALLAGGTDILNAMKDRAESPARLVSLSGIAGLREIDADGDAIRMGAMATLSDVVAHAAIREHFPGLVKSVADINSPQLRNMATVGGNLCQKPRCWYYRAGYGPLGEMDGQPMAPEGDNRYHAVFGTTDRVFYVHPSSIAVALLALDGTVGIQGPGGATREVAIADFYRVPQSASESATVLEAGELVTHVTIPISGKRNAAYEVNQRQCVDWPLVQAVAAFDLESGTARNVRIALGHVAPVPWHASAAEQALEGKPVNAATAEACGEAATEGAKPLSGNAYKVQLAKVAVKRAVLAAAGQAVEG